LIKEYGRSERMDSKEITDEKLMEDFEAMHPGLENKPWKDMEA
jgi:hypothetical protein